MASSIDAQRETDTPGTMPRLFHFDLSGSPLTLEGHADVKAFASILDVMAGAGEWAFAVARSYPQTHVVGIDGDAQLIEQASTQAHSQGTDNVRFLHMDPSRKLDFPDEAFDLVNLRFVANILPRDLWPDVLKECLRITRSGGIARFTETDLPISNSAAFERFNGLIARTLYEAHQSFSPDGVSFAITPMLGSLLSKAGYLDVQSTTAACNFSTGMAAHDVVIQDIIKAYQQVQPFLERAKVATQAEIAHLYQEMIAEMQTDNFCAIAFYLTLQGRKP